jgi:2-keto-4-pentenoate hydratase/2-oxohepta-3-ene-1,7-dioic acid hydratase in catechol pathway
VRIARLGPPGREIPVVVGHDGTAYDLRSLTRDIDAPFLTRLADDAERAEIRSALCSGRLPVVAGAGSQRRGAPIARPGKIVCIGLNYRDHAEETGADIPAEPVVFMKDPGTVIGPDDEVVLPRGGDKTDWEVELAVVIGREARYLDSAEAALGCIAGYAISNDVSERAFQLERGGEWDKGKSCETFNPLGPWLVTADEVDPAALGLALDVNGAPQQRGSTADMVFGVGEVIRYLSQFLVLRPGDLVNTGTPAGVALAGKHRYLRAGDVMELTIDGLGAQRQQVGAAR